MSWCTPPIKIASGYLMKNCGPTQCPDQVTVELPHEQGLHESMISGHYLGSRQPPLVSWLPAYWQCLCFRCGNIRMVTIFVWWQYSCGDLSRCNYVGLVHKGFQRLPIAGILAIVQVLSLKKTGVCICATVRLFKAWIFHSIWTARFQFLRFTFPTTII